LHATSTQVSTLRLLTGLPVYFAFAFGLARDHWNPLGLRNRGFFLILAPATAAAFIWMAVSEFTYTRLVVGMLLAMLSSRFILAAYQGLIALAGQDKLMCGRLSALWTAVAAIPVVIGAFTSGYISDHLPPTEALSVAPLVTLLIALFSFWKPVSVFRDSYQRPQASATDFVGNVRRWIRHRAIYPAMLISFLWNFAH
jgi:hypothetical protein